MPHEAVRVIYDTIHLDQFDLDTPIVRVEGIGDYFVMRPLCKLMGLSSSGQLEKLQTDPVYAAGVETFTVPSPGGAQPTVCLRKKELAWWIAHLDPRVVARLEKRFSVTIDDFRQALMDAADALWWGVRAVVPVPATTQAGRVEVTMHLSCLRCRTLHRFTSDGKHTSWEIAE